MHASVSERGVRERILKRCAPTQRLFGVLCMRLAKLRPRLSPPSAQLSRLIDSPRARGYQTQLRCAPPINVVAPVRSRAYESQGPLLGRSSGRFRDRIADVLRHTCGARPFSESGASTSSDVGTCIDFRVSKFTCGNTVQRARLGVAGGSRMLLVMPLTGSSSKIAPGAPALPSTRLGLDTVSIGFIVKCCAGRHSSGFCLALCSGASSCFHSAAPFCPVGFGLKGVGWYSRALRIFLKGRRVPRGALTIVGRLCAPAGVCGVHTCPFLDGRVGFVARTRDSQRSVWRCVCSSRARARGRRRALRRCSRTRRRHWARTWTTSCGRRC